MEGAAVCSWLGFPSYQQAFIAAVVVGAVMRGVEQRPGAYDPFAEDLQFHIAD